MNTEADARTLEHDLSIRFTCGPYSEEKVVLRRCAVPVSTEGVFFAAKDLIRSEPFEVMLKYGPRVVAAKSDELPFDHANPFDWASAIYDRMDKGVLGKLPFVGPALESLLPDARWQHDLWYHIAIDETGRCDYKMHIGPPYKIDLRNKCEGTCQLL